MTYRVMSGGRVVERGRIAGEDFTWDDVEDLIQRGSKSIDVPAASVIHAYAAYDGVVLHSRFIADPTTSQNPRRATYEGFDGNLDILSDLLLRPAGRGNARDLEAAVAWLLWMLGFSGAHLGQTSRLQEAPDILALSASGHVAVIECTTGSLRSDNKLALLVQRAQVVQERLAASSNKHLKVLPVIVTSRRRMEIRADIEQAERLGVSIITSETLQAAVPRTLLFGNSDAIFEEGQAAVEAALAKYTVRGK